MRFSFENIPKYVLEVTSTSCRHDFAKNNRYKRLGVTEYIILFLLKIRLHCYELRNVIYDETILRDGDTF